MKLSSEEKNYLEKLSVLSGHDIKTIQDVFMAVLVAITMEVYAGSHKILIPFLFNMKVNFTEKQTDKKVKLEESYDVQTNQMLHEIFLKIRNNENTWVEDFIKKEIVEHINSILELNNETI